MKIHTPSIKYVEYYHKKLYAFNNVDYDTLNEHSQFRIGSITKIFTGICILLHQNNLLNIHHNIIKYINKNELANITIIDVLNHTSGLKSMPNVCNDNKIYSTVTDVLNTFIDE